MLVYVLIAGAGLWALGEAITLIGGTVTVAGGWTACLGMTLAGASIWTLKDLPGMGRAGRVGIAMTGFAAFTFAMVNIIVLTGGALGEISRGTLAYADLVFTPIYLLAIIFAVAGLCGFALHFRVAFKETGWAAIFALLAAGFAARLFLAHSLAYSAGVSLLLAAVLGVLAFKRLGKI